METVIFEENEIDDDCPICGGDGWIVDDCEEDTCCCANPECDHNLIRCPRCNG
jgi:hypothetical protein